MDLFDLHVESPHLVQKPINLRFRQPRHSFLHDGIEFRTLLSHRLNQLTALRRQLGLALLQTVELFFQLAEIQADLFDSDR